MLAIERRYNSVFCEYLDTIKCTPVTVSVVTDAQRENIADVIDSVVEAFFKRFYVITTSAPRSDYTYTSIDGKMYVNVGGTLIKGLQLTPVKTNENGFCDTISSLIKDDLISVMSGQLGIGYNDIRVSVRKGAGVAWLYFDNTLRVHYDRLKFNQLSLADYTSKIYCKDETSCIGANVVYCDNSESIEEVAQKIYDLVLDTSPRYEL